MVSEPGGWIGAIGKRIHEHTETVFSLLITIYWKRDTNYYDSMKIITSEGCYRNNHIMLIRQTVSCVGNFSRW